jgi:hypothetical protein
MKISVNNSQHNDTQHNRSIVNCETSTNFYLYNTSKKGDSICHSLISFLNSLEFHNELCGPVY